MTKLEEKILKFVEAHEDDQPVNDPVYKYEELGETSESPVQKAVFNLVEDGLLRGIEVVVMNSPIMEYIHVRLTSDGRRAVENL